MKKTGFISLIICFTLLFHSMAYGLQDVQGQLQTREIYVNGQPVEITVVNVDGRNYWMLSEMAEVLDVDISYNQELNQIYLDTGAPYSELRFVEEYDYTEMAAYLRESAVEIDIHDDTYAMETGELDDYNVFLIGEGHGIAKTFDLELYMLKYLYNTQGIRHLFLEIGYCDGGLVNMYLDTGDISLIEYILENLEGTFAYSKENFKFYKNIYGFNQSLPEGEKITISGTDVQHQSTTGLYYLQLLLPEGEAPEPIREEIESLRGISTGGSYNNESFSKLVDSIELEKDSFAQYFGEDAIHFIKGVQSIQQSLTCNETEDYEAYSVLREQYMIENFISALEDNQVEKCMGIYGGFHTTLVADENDVEDMAAYLNRAYSPLSGKIASLSLIYYNSYHLDRDGNTPGGLPVYTNPGPIIEVLHEATPFDYTLFNVGTPAALEIEPDLEQQQYIILIKDSPAAQPYQ